MTRWYRAYVGTCTDPKIGAVALRAKVSRSVTVAIWHVILESAADANAGGKTDIDEFGIAAALCEPLEDVQRVLVCLKEANRFSDGQVVSWNRRQYESDTSADRTRKWRERNGDGVVTPCDVTVTPPEAYTDSEKKEFTGPSPVAGDVVKKSRRKPSGVLSSDWKPSPESVQKAQSLGLSAAEQSREVQRFRNHAVQTDRRAVNWDAAFDNWILKAAEILKKPTPSSNTDLETRFAAKPGSPQFAAWKTWGVDSGRTGFVRLLSQRELEGRAFHFDSEWPPGHVKTTEAA